ncbi:hypothetical protein ACFQ22_09800 [Lentilactobacillus raoultii]|uniref:DUF4352 domain-containing protein n=1 Tax=Lentilactobacillus raoultii TaxID=1987503 RepID=A0ABW3PPY7_9LACO|nr:hypothetical protein [Lentilactobacillus raoultii]
MKKHQLIFAVTAILALGLAGCQGTHHSNHQRKEKAALSAKMANDESSATSSQSSSDLSHYHYQVPKKEVQNKNYVKSGHLTNNHQFRYDRFGTKQQLVQNDKNHSVADLEQHRISYQILNVRVLKNTAKTAAAKQAASQALNLPTVPDTYYTFVVNYRITNNQPVSIVLNGAASVKTNRGQTLQTSNQLTDSSAGQHLASGQSQRFVLNGYLYHYAQQPATKLIIHFGPAFKASGAKAAAAPSRSLQIKLS